MIFQWSDWNASHIAKHGIAVREAEEAVENAKSPYPRRIEDDKWLLWAQAESGRYLQVIFVYLPDDEVG